MADLLGATKNEKDIAVMKRMMAVSMTHSGDDKIGGAVDGRDTAIDRDVGVWVQQSWHRRPA